MTDEGQHIDLTMRHGIARIESLKRKSALACAHVR